MFKGGGVQECVLALKEELKSRGHTVQIITPRPRIVPADYDKDIILVGSATDVKSPFHTTAQVSATLDSAALDAMLATHKFDVIHFHEPWVPLISWQLLGRSKGAAHVATFHAKLPETVMSRTIERVITPYTKTILKPLGELTAVSEAASEYVTSLTSKKPVIIPNGIDLAKYRPKPKTSGKVKTIVYVGRLEKRKGVRCLVEAFALLAKDNEDIQLQIIGDGTDRAKLEEFVDHKRIPRVVFKGYVSEEEKITAIQEADVFCSPALYGESFGIVLLEAMALGTIVLAGNNPGYTAVLKEQAETSIINPKDTKAFAARLDLLLHDEDLRHNWKQWATKYVQRFNYRDITTMYEQVYEKALKNA
jgi:phosphatidylinositol alpha-mannosyltransferase